MVSGVYVFYEYFESFGKKKEGHREECSSYGAAEMMNILSLYISHSTNKYNR